MIDVRYSDQFKRRYKQRIAKNDKLKKEFIEILETFKADRESPILNDHQLENKMFYFRAFSVNDEYRVIYILKGEIAIFTNVGTHEEVYVR